MKKASGGVTLLFKRNIKYEIKPMRVTQQNIEGVVSATCKIGESNMIVVGTYITPSGSKFAGNNAQIITEIEEFMNGREDDILKILLGDMNGRFGNTEINTNQNKFERKNKDKAIMRGQGKLVHKMCEITGMIPLKGLKLKDKDRFASGFTFERKTGKSEIDYIMIGESRINDVINVVVEDEI